MSEQIIKRIEKLERKVDRKLDKILSILQGESMEGKIAKLRAKYSGIIDFKREENRVTAKPREYLGDRWASIHGELKAYNFKWSRDEKAWVLNLASKKREIRKPIPEEVKEKTELEKAREFTEKTGELEFISNKAKGKVVITPKLKKWIEKEKWIEYNNELKKLGFNPKIVKDKDGKIVESYWERDLSSSSKESGKETIVEADSNICPKCGKPLRKETLLLSEDGVWVHRYLGVCDCGYKQVVKLPSPRKLADIPSEQIVKMEIWSDFKKKFNIIR